MLIDLIQFVNNRYLLFDILVSCGRILSHETRDDSLFIDVMHKFASDDGCRANEKHTVLLLGVLPNNLHRVHTCLVIDETAMPSFSHFSFSFSHLLDWL